MLIRLKRYCESVLWDPRFDAASAPVRGGIRVLRFVFALVRDAIEGQITLRAMGLVYTTLLAIVPLIALSFSILKGFGVHRQVQPLLYQFLAPLGAKGAELTDQVIGFVDNVRGVALGSLGLVFLLYTVISMVQKVEESFNYVWQVQRPRSFARRFTEYLSVIVVAPMLMFVAIGLAGSVSSNALVQRLTGVEVLGISLLSLGKLMPFVLVIGVFSFVYGFVPNTRVRLRAALIGGVVAGVSWGLVGKAFASFAAASDRYTLIYSTFAVVLLVLIWLYINWLLLLLGAKVAFYVQNPEYLRRGRQRIVLTNRLRERLALQVMYLVGADFSTDQSRWTVNTLATHIGLPSNALSPVIADLEASRLLTMTEDELLMPTRDTDAIRVADILHAVRDGPSRTRPRIREDDRIRDLADQVDGAIDASIARMSLRDLVTGTATIASGPGSPGPASDDNDETLGAVGGGAAR